MNSNHPASGPGSPDDSRSESAPSPSSISPTWAENATVHLPHSQNLNMATGGSSTVVNIINHGGGAQTTYPQQDDFDDLTATARADHEIYSSRLLTQKRGYPLWVPGPGMQLPIEYRRQGVSIGDVGIITSSGEFDFLFNMFLEATHPINRGLVPENFLPHPCQDLDIHRTVVYGPNTHLACTSVRKIATHLTNETSIDHRFESTAKEAAILVMPLGATSLDLLHTRGIHFTISRKASDWYTYAEITRGRDVKDGDIRVVVGVDKVASWGIATSSCKIGQTASCVFKHDPIHAYKWDCTGGSGRVGPQKSETDDLIGGNVVLQNQCVFVRTIIFNRSGDTWFSPDAVQQTGVGSGNFFGSRDSGKQHSSGSRHTRSGSDSSFSSHQPLSMQGSLQSLNPDPMEPKAAHPSAELQNCLNGKSGIIDADSISVMSNDDAKNPSGRILEVHESKNGNTMRVREVGTQLIDSESQAEVSPKTDENQDTKPRVPANVSDHERETQPLDQLHQSIEPPQDGLKTPSEHSSTEDVVDHESDDSHGANPDKQRPSLQEETDTVESSSNHDPSIEQAIVGDPQRTTKNVQSCAGKAIHKLVTSNPPASTTRPEPPEDLRPTPTSEPREWGDNERLAELGASVLNNAVTFHLFSIRPVLRAEEIRAWRARYTSQNMLENWLHLCQLKQNFRVPPNHGLEQMAACFRRHVATMYFTKGPFALQTWIAGLIDSDIGPLTKQSNSFSGPSHSSPSSPLTSLASSVIVNTTASKRRVPVKYLPSQEGPDHQPIWTVRCLIDNVEKGVGVAKSQKVAKEEAARQTLVKMGW